MKKSAFISDVFFAFGAFALFTLCLFRFLGLRLFPACALAVLCGLLAAGAAWAYLKSKRNAFALKKSEEREKEKLLIHLALLSDEKKTEFFREAFTENGIAPMRFSKLRLYDEERFCFLSFRFSPVTADEVSSISRWKTPKKKLLLCNAIDKEAEALCKNIGVEAKTGEEVYALLKSRNALPAQYLGESETANKKEKRLRLCFSKRNGKRFFIGGALVLCTSLLTPFPYYYLVFGSILLFLSVFIRIFGYA